MFQVPLPAGVLTRMGRPFTPLPWAAGGVTDEIRPPSGGGVLPLLHRRGSSANSWRLDLGEDPKQNGSPTNIQTSHSLSTTLRRTKRPSVFFFSFGCLWSYGKHSDRPEAAVRSASGRTGSTGTGVVRNRSAESIGRSLKMIKCTKWLIGFNSVFSDVNPIVSPVNPAR